VIDNFETALRRANKNKGIIVAFSFGKGAHEEVARAKLHDNMEIELKTVDMDWFAGQFSALESKEEPKEESEAEEQL